MSYRVLTLDGGGAWALIEVRTLIELFGADAKGRDVLRRFDMVAANSGGSIVLAGLIEDKTLGEILSLFEDEANRRAIFAPTTEVLDRWLEEATGLGPKYSTAAKLTALQRLLPATGGTRLCEVMRGIAGPAGADVHALIVGFDYDRNAATFFRSADASGDAWGTGAPTTLTLAECVHASTNAPIDYFDQPASVPNCPDRYWDGAMTGHNNPALAACTEALVLGQEARALRVLSLGTGTVRLPLADAGVPASPYFASRGAAGLAADVTKLATAILDDPQDFATFAVHVITGGTAGLPAGVASRLVRLSPLVSPVMIGGAWTAPAQWTADQFSYLCGIGMDAVAPVDVTYVADWCQLWIGGTARNQPIRMDRQTLASEIGYDRFADAVAAWRVLDGL